MSNQIIKLSKITCPLCKKVFEWKYDFSRHFCTMHTRQRLHKCKICSKGFFKLSALNIHRRLHVANSNIEHTTEEAETKKKISEVYKNVVSETLYSSDSDCEYELLQTIIRVTSIRNCTYFCEYCNKKFVNADSLKRHVTNKHLNIEDAEMSSNNIDTMQVDDKEVGESMVIDKEALEDNMQIDDLSIDKMDSDNHEIITIRTVTTDSDSEGDVFRHRSQLSNHHKLHLKHSVVESHDPSGLHSSFSRKYRCHLCSRSYSQKIYLERHIWQHETGKVCGPFEDPMEEKFLCSYCGKQFNDRSQLKAHIKLHVDPKRYLCSVCGKAFALERYLLNHQKIHTQEKLFSCEYCNKKFIHKTSLVEHLRIHTGVKPHECIICDKKFTHYTGLTQHLRYHSNEKKHVCYVCGKCFTFGGQYRTHMRTHTGDKPYSCKICDKKFASSGSLTIHHRTHSGERPYECKICKKGFIKSSNLKQHMKTHFTCKKKKEKVEIGTNDVEQNVEDEFISQE